ncbi:hypothetical protein CBS101457_003623 [Exobasidium rhododendri]|nr:hypothetical protein CBS101457_003623 [Exobasidium rhododendri]
MTSSSIAPSASASASSQRTSHINDAPWRSNVAQSRSSLPIWPGPTIRRSKQLSQEHITSEAVHSRVPSGSVDSHEVSERQDASPQPHSVKGSQILSGSSRLARTSSTTSDRQRSRPKDQWWEHVLPPGQLAERFRRAQQGSSSESTRSLAAIEDRSKAARKNVLSEATPSERKIWTSLADFGRGDGRIEPNRSEANSSRSSVGSLRSIRSDNSSISNGTSIHSVEEGTLHRRGTSEREDWEQRSKGRDVSGTISPPYLHSMSRSTTCRRSRVLDSNDGGLGSANGAKAGQVSDVDLKERLGQWNSKLPFQPPSRTSSHTSLRPFPRSVEGRMSPTRVLSDTPEVSSDEEHKSDEEYSMSTTTKTKKTTIRRTTKQSNSVNVVETVRDATPRSSKRRSMPIFAAPTPSPRRTSLTAVANTDGSHTSSLRHVSFSQNVEVSGGEKQSSQTLGRQLGRSHSLLNDTSSKGRSWQPDPARQPLKVFPTLASGAIFTDPSVPPPSSVRGRRMPCYSAPTSPRLVPESLEKTATRPLAETSLKLSEEGTSKLQDVALLSSSEVAQTQMASANSLALTFTHHLSLSLKPMLYLTILLSISSFAFVALAGCLVIGYMITAWDDVNSRGKVIQKNVSSVKSWCGKLLLGGQDGSSPPPPDASSLKHDDEQQHHHTSSRMLSAPIRFAFAFPATIAYKLTPTAISDTLGLGSEREDDTASRSTNPHTSSSSHGGMKGSRSDSPPDFRASIPPRPPLSALLPSILLTILLALGAGIISFFVNRSSQTASDASSAASLSKLKPVGSSLRPSLSSSSSFSSSSHPKSSTLQRRSSVPVSSPYGSARHRYTPASYDGGKPYEVVDI